MSNSDVIRETLVMMGLTFLIGFALAYLIKVMIWSFLSMNRRNMSSVVTHYKAYSRSKRMEMARIRRALDTMDGDLVNYTMEDPNRNDKKEKVGGLYGIAGFRYGQSARKSKEKDKDEEMNRLYEFHHGEV